MCRGRWTHILLHLHIQSEGRPCEVAELVGVLVAETIHPACMCEGGGRGGERGWHAFYYTYIYSQKGRPCEVAEFVGVLVAETIHPACMCIQYSVIVVRGNGVIHRGQKPASRG